jgi:Zn-dependent protease
MSWALIHQILILALPLIVAIVFHEIAHGLAAKMLGDPTASEAKRLSLNPLRHVDPVGTILLPGMLALAHLPPFGWAKPVPVNKWRLRNPRVGMMIVAAAGPASNIVMAVLGAVGLGLIERFWPSPAVLWANQAVMVLGAFVQINIFVALFNLLPIPPFDGSHIVEGVLPGKAAAWYGQFRKLGFALVLGLLVVLPRLVPGFDLVGPLVGPPFDWLYGQVLHLARLVGGL